jgi:hypothetical protein
MIETLGDTVIPKEVEGKSLIAGHGNRYALIRGTKEKGNISPSQSAIS